MIYTDNSIQNELLIANNISDEAICRTMSLLRHNGCSWGDIYIQKTISRDWIFEDNHIKTGGFTIDKGVGVRGLDGENSLLSHSNSVSEESITELANVVCSGIKASPKSTIIPVNHSYNYSNTTYTGIDTTNSKFIPIQLSMIGEVNEYARSRDRRVQDVIISFQTEIDLVSIFRLDGKNAYDARPMSYLSISIVVEENGKRERASSGGGGRVATEFFTLSKIKKWVDSALSEALHNLYASPAPAGTMPVVLGHGWPGILLHEAVGHGLESDFIRKETSSFTKKMGHKIASDVVTIVDDGTIPNLRGSLRFDDEGTPTKKTTLIENGIMVGMMTDILNADALGVEPTGNGRRESFASLPLPRMTNTFMLPGKDSVADIIASVDKGIYASNFNGGQVDITSGNFVFNMSQAWLIEKGKISRPIKGAMLSGSGADALLNVKMVANDCHFDEGTGQCGKDGQSIPVTVGMPTIRIDNLTVGGNAL